jgi:signal transduction histidine kinase
MFRMCQAEGNISDFLKISIIDTGIGMEERDIENLFNLFGKLDDNAQINKQGTGLGLFISKQLCQKLGGDIFVQSQKGAGT